MKSGQNDEIDLPAWYILRTQVKRERLAAVNLRQLEEVEVFLPRLRYQKTTRRGRIWWVEALFPGYLLAKFSLTEMGRAVGYAQGVSRIVGFGSEVPQVPESFVKELREEVEKLDDGSEEITVDWKIAVGDEVELAGGPFQGMEGQVLEVLPGAERVKILLEFLGGEKPIEVSLQSLLLAEHTIPEGWKHAES